MYAPAWNPDSAVCGLQHFLADGRPGECDPTANENKKGPCCSDEGWCGNWDGHCKCDECRDFRLPGKYIPGSACIPSHQPIRGIENGHSQRNSVGGGRYQEGWFGGILLPILGCTRPPGVNRGGPGRGEAMGQVRSGGSAVA